MLNFVAIGGATRSLSDSARGRANPLVLVVCWTAILAGCVAAWIFALGLIL